MYIVVMMPRAKRQLEHVYAWWLEQHSGAAPVAEALRRALSIVSSFPHAGHAVTWHGNELRRFQLAGLQYAILYRVRSRAKRVEIVAFLDNDRPP